MRTRWMLLAAPAAILVPLVALTPASAGTTARTTVASSLVSLAGAGRLTGSPTTSVPSAAHSGEASRAPLMWPGKAGPAWTGRLERPADPARETFDDVFNGDSCSTQPDNPAIKITCEAVGYYADAPYVNGLQESSSNSVWGSNVFGSDGPVTEALAVSCVPQQADIPACVAVGEHFKNPKYSTQLVESGTANGFSPISLGNPKGANWSVLDEVSCVSANFCILVGGAGKIGKHAVSTEHAIAYRWGGATVHPISLPIPAHARSSELAGVSCPTTTNCLAVGNFVDSAGRTLPYSVQWTPSASHLHLANSLGGKAATVFQDVSCGAANQCVGVGDTSNDKKTTSFAEKYSTGTWSVLHPSTGTKTAFFDVSCPATSYCVAVGEHGSDPLIEAWNGSHWKWEAFPAPARPFTAEGLGHISCISPTLCVAVGFRHDPAVRYSFRTLALGWNGKTWTFEKTFNE